ncbi:23S rRNA (adenine(2030)-N(6))-methyltransferase RlmJ [Ralstonia mannitolilytica]|uniref:Ribosomal RNA large subunit methyltransferase J n=1 Tax=Ralstonia mannitolilytica TaxID=105219 RepID=A0AAJ4ZIM5_9RALS|nr:23S rRNA (adenine(2030)-N(6))-methyltransferase RlmJ [Ralstonia mannitolilytica]AJW43718.1 competence protein ComJ [Ralstonia mannitolilytica]MBU9579751.1 23S rRNA (adenine(2030)-N(6))-methyltransferase RlmJ [Ralstonia mannitolilytica]QIF08960.1 23S rRNA (adenine(2030)-N(6))-methyltransferase RlmJ [Ralstonia mannitolilytica]CAG2145642.1 Ribosomal RNA large subunit methyltransferase J [Ralstonia mannitolilytica]CAJ0728271.1 Ribosomal RNA large subunit methyltransferase J [Ralstonia mannitoli
MLSYRHAFHAGNHADVLKHAVLVQMLDYLTQKDKPFWYIDTHAGAGLYALDHEWAQKKAEFDTGIGPLWRAAEGGETLPPLLDAYLDQVRELNPNGELRHYPGSPWLAWQMLRDADRLRLFELHSSEIKVLSNNFRGAGRKVMLYDGDGFAGIKAILPPPPRRALVLIDPSFEDKHDYARTVQAVQDSLQRFATGMYAIWYPQVQRREAAQFPARLKQLRLTDWLHVTLTVRRPVEGGLGLHGSGMFIVNPPWTLKAQLQEALPTLVRLLGQDDGAKFMLEGESS